MSYSKMERGYKRMREEIPSTYVVESRMHKRARISPDFRRRSHLKAGCVQEKRKVPVATQKKTDTDKPKEPTLERCFSFGEVQFQSFEGFNAVKKPKWKQREESEQISVKDENSLKISINLNQANIHYDEGHSKNSESKDVSCQTISKQTADTKKEIPVLKIGACRCNCCSSWIRTLSKIYKKE